MKKLLFFSIAALALSACTDDEYVGESNLTKADNAISFNSGTAALTRAVGADAAAKLGNSMVVFGYKSYTPAQTVFDHYTVNWGATTAGSTESNSAGWEYVGQPLNILSSLTSGTEQSIKYWDFAATSYDFIAFSLGEQTSANKLTQVAADATPADNQVAISKVTTTDGPTYTIKGKLADIAKVYIADRVTAKNNVAESDKVANRLVAYKDPVKFNFHAATAKVRMGIYETIPGYSVKDVKFYAMGTGTEATILTDANQKPTLYSTAATAPIANATGVVTATVTFPETDATKPDYNKAKVTLPTTAMSKDMTFGDLTLKAAEHKETGSDYLGRTSNDASLCEFVNVFPCTPGALTLKVDYTLVSRDGSGETIKVKGATATVPAEYGNWKPNFAYTYIFKISDNTNGQIGDETGLYPITFDAIVTETEDGIQETITTVASPSITTYAKGEMVTANNEYLTEANIYVKVNGATLSLTSGSENCALYTATVEAGAAQGITEESVANAIANGTRDDAAKTYTVTDANTKKLVITDASGLSIATKIVADDAPDGIAISGNFAKFTPSTAGTYVFEYNDGAAKHYKVIKVVAP